MLLKNVEVRWASLLEPNTKFEPHRWEVEAILDKKQAAELAEYGFKLKTDEDGNTTYRFRRKIQGKKKNGETFEYKQPSLIDAGKEKFERLVGNGSICNIQYNIKTTNMLGNTYVTGDLAGVQVKEHVPFGEDDEFEVEGETTEVQVESTEESTEDDIPY